MATEYLNTPYEPKTECTWMKYMRLEFADVNLASFEMEVCVNEDNLVAATRHKVRTTIDLADDPHSHWVVKYLPAGARTLVWTTTHTRPLKSMHDFKDGKDRREQRRAERRQASAE